MADTLENRTYDEIQPGQTAELQRTLTRDDVALFSKVSGDLNPIHMDEEYARARGAKGVVGHSLWATGLVSSLLANVLPGPGTVYRSQEAEFHRQVQLGDTLTAKVKVLEKHPEQRVVLECSVVDQNGEPVMTGRAIVVAPVEKLHIEVADVAEVSVRHHDSFGALFDKVRALEPIPTAVVHPVDQVSLEGAMEAAEATFIKPILVGPEQRIRGVAEEHGIALAGAEIIDVEHSHAAAARAVALIREGTAEILMKGSLHTDEVLSAVLNKSTGIRTERRISHIFVMDVPTYPKLLLISDAAVNIAPDLDAKADICLQDGRSRPDHRRHPRRPAGDGQRDRPGGGEDQAHHLAGGRARPDPGGAGPGGRQHAGEEPDLPRGRRRGRDRPRGGGADHPHQPRRQRLILTLNAGSSSIKFAVYGVDAASTEPALRAKGQVEGIGSRPHFIAKSVEGQLLSEGWWEAVTAGAGSGHARAFQQIWGWLDDFADGESIMAVGHRVAHGGEAYSRPVRITPDIIEVLTGLIPLVPLHQPNNLAAIRAVAADHPALPQVACFDTGFHRGRPLVTEQFGLPRALLDRGVKRYGFHGLSYEYIVEKLREVAPDIAEGRVVVAHLGSGCSMTAIKNGRSVDTTMGFSALDGVPMGTRPGLLDPGVILFLMREDGLGVEALERLLYKQSGLLGLSGVSNDLRALHQSDDPRAAEAIDYFVYRIGQTLGSLCASIGGLDALVFTAGVGENDADIRERVCADAAWLGVEIDAEANATRQQRISPDGQTPQVWVLPTDEERMIARHTLRVVRGT
jgi:acetate kinase